MSRMAGTLQAPRTQASPAGHPAPAPGSRARRPALDDALFAALVVLLAWVPFWFGGNQPVAWGLNALLFSLLLAAHEIGLAVRRQPYPVAPRRIALSIAGMGVLVAFALVQALAPVPAVWQAPLWAAAADALGRPVAGAMSVDPDGTLLAVLRLLPALIAFWLALQLCRSAARARRLLNALALISGAYALYGIVALLWFPHTLLWFEKVDYVGYATSTFINRNSYATYAGMGALTGIAALAAHLARVGEAGAGGWRGVLSAFLMRGAGLPLLVSLAVIANVAALMLAASRGGFAATMTGLCVFLAAQFLKRGARLRAAVLIALALPVLAVVAAHFDDALTQRVTGAGLVDPLRLAIVRLTAATISDQPWTGFGYGTFEEVFRIYRDAGVAGRFVIDKAHNTYAELAQGVGLPVFLIAIGAQLLLVSRCIRGFLKRRRHAEFPLLAVAVSVLVGGHALVDFSIQMPAVAVTFAAVLGMGVAQSWSQTRSVAG